MSENPLAGLSVPSPKEMAAEIVSRMGSGPVDLSNPLRRLQLVHFIEESLERALDWRLAPAVRGAVDKAVDHVFRLMKDPGYQEKRRRYYATAKIRRAEARKKKAEAERIARMAYSRGRLQVKDRQKETIQ